MIYFCWWPSGTVHKTLIWPTLWFCRPISRCTRKWSLPFDPNQVTLKSFWSFILVFNMSLLFHFLSGTFVLLFFLYHFSQRPYSRSKISVPVGQLHNNELNRSFSVSFLDRLVVLEPCRQLYTIKNGPVPIWVNQGLVVGIAGPVGSIA